MKNIFKIKFFNKQVKSQYQAHSKMYIITAN
jgi:hypothetical protein